MHFFRKCTAETCSSSLSYYIKYLVNNNYVERLLVVWYHDIRVCLWQQMMIMSLMFTVFLFLHKWGTCWWLHIICRPTNGWKVYCDSSSSWRVLPIIMHRTSIYVNTWLRVQSVEHINKSTARLVVSRNKAQYHSIVWQASPFTRGRKAYLYASCSSV
jgi:hypothetical protein